MFADRRPSATTRWVYGAIAIVALTAAVLSAWPKSIEVTVANIAETSRTFEIWIGGDRVGSTEVPGERDGVAGTATLDTHASGWWMWVRVVDRENGLDETRRVNLRFSNHVVVRASLSWVHVENMREQPSFM